MIFTGGDIVLEDRLSPNGAVVTAGSLIQAVLPGLPSSSKGEQVIDLQGGYLVPGYVDLHVHGGAGADFMDGTPEAFRTAIAAHTRHGTTSLLPTTTVARHEQQLAFLRCCRQVQREETGGATILGAHFYGPLLRARGPRLPSSAGHSSTPALGV
jgi:N-acetylglucosamine-6-phosphate deacetylase